MAGIKVKIKSNNGTLDFYFNSGDQSLIITKYKSKSKYKDNKDDISLGSTESRNELFSNLSELSNVLLRLNFNSIEIERE